jgi:transposase InsO family protein
MARTRCKTEGEDEGEFMEIFTCDKEWQRWPESEAAGRRPSHDGLQLGHGDGNRTKKGREIEIRWGRPPNVHGNGKMERDRRGEHDGVLTFG